MVGPWRHRPGTLRALQTILQGPFHLICRPCRRYAPMEVERQDLDRPFEPCPFRCSSCGTRAEIVEEVPAGFTLTPMAPKAPKPREPQKEQPALGPWHTPSF